MKPTIKLIRTWKLLADFYVFCCSLCRKILCLNAVFAKIVTFLIQSGMTVIENSNIKNYHISQWITIIHKAFRIPDPGVLIRGGEDRENGKWGFFLVQSFEFFSRFLRPLKVYDAIRDGCICLRNNGNEKELMSYSDHTIGSRLEWIWDSRTHNIVEIHPRILKITWCFYFKNSTSKSNRLTRATPWRTTKWYRRKMHSPNAVHVKSYACSGSKAPKIKELQCETQPWTYQLDFIQVKNNNDTVLWYCMV